MHLLPNWSPYLKSVSDHHHQNIIISHFTSRVDLFKIIEHSVQQILDIKFLINT